MVKVIYLSLAVLMGGGLVLFGIGGDVSGGLLDAFSGGGGGGGNEEIEKQIDKHEKQLQAQPNSQPALRKPLVREYYQLATAQIPENQSVFPQEAQDDLRKSDLYWKRYVKVVGDEKVNIVARQPRGPALRHRSAQPAGRRAGGRPHRRGADRTSRTPICS